MNFFFHADSDLIFRKDWCEVGLQNLSNSEGVLSIFNAPNHIGMSVGDGLIEKRNIGAAGTFFRREIIELFMKRLEKGSSHSFDWKWSEVLQQCGIKLLVTEKSYVQHIGIIGQNSGMESFDFGEEFEVDSIVNGQILNDLIVDLSKIRIRKEIAPVAVFPFSEVEKGAEIVIYGAGKFGHDYVKQVEATGFCNIVGQIDAHYLEHDGTFPVSAINNMNYDKVVVAINDYHALCEAVGNLKKYGVRDEQIVFKTGIKEFKPQ